MENQNSCYTSIESISNKIKARAVNLGFCLFGITSIKKPEQYNKYETWLAANQHGDMEYLDSERHRNLRQDPLNLVPWAKSILVLAWPYLLSDSSAKPHHGVIAGYAGEHDYHHFLPNIIESLISELPMLFGGPVQSQVFTDSAPILERELAVRAGLGWIGRNSCLIHPDHGSAFLLAELFIDQELPATNEKYIDLCGKCHRCVDACPTQCILPDHTIDAERCLSNLTIENKGLIPQEFLPFIENRVLGCDLCQSVCPWNQSRKKIDPNPRSFDEQEMISLLSINDERFQKQFSETVFLRLKRHGLIRNLCAVLGNLKSTSAIPALESVFLNDPSPIARRSAEEALFRIDSTKRQ